MARFRPFMPLSVKLEACLLALGLDPKDAQFDHTPSLELRPFDEAAGDYEPKANDPRYIVPRSKADHLRKTTGRAGESDLSISYQGDVSRIAKTRRLDAAIQETRQRIADRLPGEKRKPKGTIPARKKPPRQRKLRRTEAERARMEGDHG